MPLLVLTPHCCAFVAFCIFPVQEGKVKIVITLPQALHDGAYVLSGILLSDDGAVLARTSEQTFTVAKSTAPALSSGPRG